MRTENRPVRLPDLRRLKHFEALYRLRSFGRAAEEVGVTQSALSRSLQKLEDELGAVLFDRTTHAVRATEAGDRLARLSQDVLSAAAALLGEAAALNKPVSGLVRLGCGPYPLQPLVSDAIAAFATRLPGVRVEVTVGRSETLLQDLIDRKLDLVVCDISKFDRSPYAADVTVAALPSEPLALVCAAGHPAARGRLDTTLYPWALPTPSPISEARFAEALKTRLKAGTFPDYQIDSTEACLNVVRSGRAVTVVPRSLARLACADGVLTHRRLGADSRTNDGVHVLRRRTQSVAVRTFIEVLRAAAKGMAEP